MLFGHVRVWQLLDSQILRFSVRLSYQVPGVLVEGSTPRPLAASLLAQTHCPPSALCCFGARKAPQQEVALEENAGFCRVTPTLFSEAPQDLTVSCKQVSCPQPFTPPNRMMDP